MREISYTDSDYSARLAALIERPAILPEIEAAAAEIIGQVARDGDRALVRYAEKFDGVRLSPGQFRVGEDEWARAESAVSEPLRRAVDLAHAQLADFAGMRIPQSWRAEPRPGVTVGERFLPLSRLGAYVPGGTAPLVSTVLHTVTLAAVAGVEEIVVVTPPKQGGRVDSAILYAARRAGATEVLRLGGVYAVAALALGTETVGKVEKIVGPGNAYVTAAKKLLYGRVALDMVAGPSEIMVVADRTADPRFVAADMLSQIEHGSGHEQAVLATDSGALIAAVREQLTARCERLPRARYIRECMARGVFLIRVRDLAEATDLAGRYAPEHLELICEDAESVAERVSAAGAIFIGPWTPEPVGDFVAGPSHVLPTGGAARYFSGLTVEQCFRRMSVVKYEEAALRRELPAIMALAEAEGLGAHRESAAIRCAGNAGSGHA